MGNVLLLTRKMEGNQGFSGLVKSLDDECRNCAPITPLECISRCQVYRLKNELRTLREMMDNPNYIKQFFNVLKNETRLTLLQAIAKGRYSAGKLQTALKNAGQKHSLETISEEYMGPLLAVGLATEARDEYYATTFGKRLIQQLGCFAKFAEKLPVHSECYEETLLQALLSGPKTFEEIQGLIPPKAVSRILKRLELAKFVHTPKERDYIFFFKSKRDQEKETFTATERKIYDKVACQGISAGRLAKETGLSKRGTYKYLRRLKGKKLLFIRRTPKIYGLTSRGKKLASLLRELEQLVEDTSNSSKLVMHQTAHIPLLEVSK